MRFDPSPLLIGQPKQVASHLLCSCQHRITKRFSPQPIYWVSTLVNAAGRDWLERGLAMPPRLELPDELAEAFEIGALQPDPLGLGKGHRIDRLAVLDDLEMQMRAGGPPGTADEADHL